MIYAARSHIGRVRQMNQDYYAVHMESEPWHLLIVADGMGGASAGEVASQMAVETVSSQLLEHLTDASADPGVLLRHAIFSANQRIWKLAQEVTQYAGMGTTVVAALVDESTAVFANVGDSRGYLLHQGNFRQVTHDHSLVAELVRRGQLTEEEALHHPQRNIVTRSLGTVASNEADVEVLPWEPGDALLLCSDGLSNLVSCAELAEFLQAAAAAQSQDEVERSSDRMLHLALERGAPDNITLIVAAHSQGGDPA